MEHAEGKRRLVPASGQSASRPSVGAGVPTARSVRRVLLPLRRSCKRANQVGSGCGCVGRGTANRALLPTRRNPRPRQAEDTAKPDPILKGSGFAMPLVRCFVPLRSLLFCLIVFQLGFQEQVDILRKGSVILLCPFAQLRQQIPVYRDADFLFQWFHMITRCQYSRTMRKTLDK